MNVAELNAEEYVTMFYELVCKGNTSKAMEMLYPDRNPSFGEGRLRAASELFSNAFSGKPQVAEAKDRAFAVFKAIRFEDEHEDVGKAGCPVFWLARDNDRWWIKDMDIASEKHALQQFEVWRKTNGKPVIQEPK